MSTDIGYLIDQLRTLVELLADDQTRPPKRRTRQLLTDWAARGYPDHTPGADPTSAPPPRPDRDQPLEDDDDQDRGRRSLVSDPTAQAATHRDEWQRRHDQWTRILTGIADNTADAIRTLTLVHAIDDRDEPHRKTGAGYCQACGEWAPGTPDNRIRSGYCVACYTAWTRAERPERAPFERGRRARAEDRRRTRVALESATTPSTSKKSPPNAASR